ncbi:transposase [Streptomyces sp. NPDC098085]|uniref:transposase n=1 Tax=unclassified Streptomyces TaxID=2593676 RepID=UPI003803CE01
MCRLSGGPPGPLGRWREDRQVFEGILHRVRTGAQWRDLPERFGPWKTASERHRLWSADGAWERLLEEVQAEADAADGIDGDIAVESTEASRWTRRAVPSAPASTRYPAQRFQRRPTADAACLRKGSRGGRPPGFDEERYKKRNTVERAINRPKQSGVVASRYGKRGYVFLGTATTAALAIWLRT